MGLMTFQSIGRIPSPNKSLSPLQRLLHPTKLSRFRMKEIKKMKLILFSVNVKWHVSQLHHTDSSHSEIERSVIGTSPGVEFFTESHTQSTSHDIFHSQAVFLKDGIVFVFLFLFRTLFSFQTLQHLIPTYATHRTIMLTTAILEQETNECYVSSTSKKS